MEEIISEFNVENNFLLKLEKSTKLKVWLKRTVDHKGEQQSVGSINGF